MSAVTANTWGRFEDPLLGTFPEDSDRVEEQKRHRTAEAGKQTCQHAQRTRPTCSRTRPRARLRYEIQQIFKSFFLLLLASRSECRDRSPVSVERSGLLPGKC